MKTIKLKQNILLYYIEADSFPEGILQAHQKLHSLIGYNSERRYFGISWPDKDQKIQYKAAAEELRKGELKKHALKSYTIKKGDYIYIDLKNFRKNIAAIGKSFQKLLQHPDIDPHGECIEWYHNFDDCRCMIRIN